MTRAATLPDLGQDGALRVAFQPIYEVRADGRRVVHSLEALVRGPRATPFESASVLFDHVRRAGQEVSVDRLCIAAIFRALVRLSSRPDVAINVHASTLGTDGFVPFLEALAAREGVSLSRVTLEIVEHGSPCALRILKANLRRLRARKVRIALDDVGAGHSNYRMMLDCRPDIIKIDRYLVAGCHADPQRQAVLDSIARLASRLGARAVAEGVEQSEDLGTLATLGIDLVQGFLLAVPFFPPEVTATWLHRPGSVRGAPPRRRSLAPEVLP